MTNLPPWRRGHKLRRRKKAEWCKRSPAPSSQSGTPAPVNSETRWRVYRRRYLVEKLPPRIQTRVFEMYAGGATYNEISAAVEKLGFRIHRQALARYWRRVWHKEHDRLIEARAVLAILKDAFHLDPNSPTSKVAEELLYTTLVLKLKELEEKPPQELLEQARAQQKAGGEKGGKGEKREAPNAVEAAREIRRRWRELYGVNEKAETSDEKEGR